MSQEIHDHDGGVSQTHPLWEESYMASTWFIVAQICTDLTALDIVSNVFPASCLFRGAPLQEDAGLVYVGDGVSWGGRGLCKMIQYYD